MPFGKFRGEEVADLDVGYLQWLKVNVKLWGALYDEVEKVLTQTATTEVIDDEDVVEIVGEWPQ